MNYMTLSLLILLSAGLCAMEAPPKLISLSQLDLKSLDGEQLLLKWPAVLNQYTPRAREVIAAVMEYYIKTKNAPGKKKSNDESKTPKLKSLSKADIEKLDMGQMANIAADPNVADKYTPRTLESLANASINIMHVLLDIIKGRAETALSIARAEGFTQITDYLETQKAKMKSKNKPKASALKSLSKSDIEKLDLDQLSDILEDRYMEDKYTPRTAQSLDLRIGMGNHIKPQKTERKPNNELKPSGSKSLSKSDIAKLNTDQLADMLEDPNVEDKYTPRTVQNLDSRLDWVGELSKNIKMIDEKRAADGDFDINAFDKDRLTLLMRAVIGNSLRHVRTLVERWNSSIDITNERGETALSLARAEGYTEIVDYLETQKTRSTRKSLSKSDIEKLDVELRDIMADPDVEVKYTPRTIQNLDSRLDWVVELSNNIKEIREKMAAGGDFDINAFDKDGLTLLMRAVKGNSLYYIIPIIEELNASIDITNERGETALSIARAAGYTKIVYYLETQKRKLV